VEAAEYACFKYRAYWTCKLIKTERIQDGWSASILLARREAAVEGCRKGTTSETGLRIALRVSPDISRTQSIASLTNGRN